MSSDMVARANCEGENPEFFYPENPKHAKQSVIELSVQRAITALRLCESCPLLEECREFTFKSLDLSVYGISAGLLPTEKRRAIGVSMSDLSEPFWNTIRKRARALGITEPIVGQVKKPKRLYAMEDSEILNKRQAS